MKIKSLKSLVFYQANNMVKNDGLDHSKALKIAWQIYRLKKSGASLVCFRFQKIDGSLRYAKGKFFAEVSDNDIKAQHYFDVEKNEYRAFKPCHLLGIDSVQ